MSYIRKQRTQIGFWRMVNYTAANWMFRLGLRRTYYAINDVFEFDFSPRAMQLCPSTLDSKFERVVIRGSRAPVYPSERR